MEHPFVRLWNQPERFVVGLMSGTSADGVDAVLVRISGSGTDLRVQQMGFVFLPFDEAVQQRILETCRGDIGGSREICLLNSYLGQYYVNAVKELLRSTGLERVDLIGTHGQTVFHNPQPVDYLGKQIVGTLQIGDPAYLAEQFHCPVVSDFRMRDVAAGGQGAPLVPYTEFLLYRSEQEDVALQNIGGIGNVTLLKVGCNLEDVVAFDTGPGNMVMDALVRRMTNGKESFDRGGRLAASGCVHPTLLEELLKDPYLQRHPPKTTGREYYGKKYVDWLIDKAREMAVSPVDLLATATCFTAKTIELSLRQFAKKIPSRLVVGGGGSKNQTLLAFLKQALPEVQVLTQEDLGMDSDAKEAVAFAILANEALFAVPNNAPSATGAAHVVVMGRVNL